MKTTIALFFILAAVCIFAVGLVAGKNLQSKYYDDKGRLIPDLTVKMLVEDQFRELDSEAYEELYKWFPKSYFPVDTTVIK